MNVQLVTDTSYANQDGEMDVTPIVVDNTMTFDAIDGILFYGFGNYRLLPRNNNDFMNPSVTLDSISVPTSPIGLDEWASMNLKAFPNPSNDWMQLESQGPGTWSIYSIHGQQVLEFQTDGSLRISTLKLETGYYVARFRGLEGAGTLMFMVQR